MRKVGAIVRREWQENIRQRWLVGTLASLLALITVFSLWLLSWLDGFAAGTSIQKRLGFWLDVLGMPLEDPVNQLAGLTIQAFDYLVITQLLGMTAVLAGHAALHDRQSGTLPFLMLAPVTRFELLVGKVLGAMALPLVLYLGIGGVGAIVASTMEVTASQAAYLPPRAGWFVAYGLGGPAWAIFIGALCVSISAVAHDVRTAQQAAWFLVFFATFVICPLLVNLMPMGAPTQLVVAAIGVVLGLGAMRFAATILSRDLGR